MPGGAKNAHYWFEISCNIHNKLYLQSHFITRYQNRSQHVFLKYLDSVDVVYTSYQSAELKIEYRLQMLVLVQAHNTYVMVSKCVWIMQKSGLVHEGGGGEAFSPDFK